VGGQGNEFNVYSSDADIDYKKLLKRFHMEDLDTNAVLDYPSVFDEVVIDDWFHLEQMDTHWWWMRIDAPDGSKSLTIDVRVKNGKAIEIHYEEGA
jgi:hypothetical protein